MRRRLIATWITLSAALALPAGEGGIVDVDMVIGASGPAGGTLRMVHDFTRPVVVTPSGSADGFTRWTTTQPGFDAVDPLTEAGPGLQAVKAGVPIRVELTSVDAGASFKLGSAVLDAPGESAAIATAPDLHVHGEWRLILPDGVIGSYTIAFRLTTTSPAYAPSPAYTFVVTNDPSAPPPTTSTTLAGIGDQRLAGARIALVARAGKPQRTRLAVASTDGALALDGADPTVAGATVRLVAGGAAPFDVVLDLPAAGWRRIGRAGKGWRYRGVGPIRSATLRPGKGFALAGRGAGLPFTLAGEPDAVHIVLAVGVHRACLTFGGVTRWTASKRFTGRDAPAPGACPS